MTVVSLSYPPPSTHTLTFLSAGDRPRHISPNFLTISVLLSSGCEAFTCESGRQVGRKGSRVCERETRPVCARHMAALCPTLLRMETMRQCEIKQTGDLGSHFAGEEKVGTERPFGLARVGRLRHGRRLGEGGSERGGERVGAVEARMSEFNRRGIRAAGGHPCAKSMMRLAKYVRSARQEHEPALCTIHAYPTLRRAAVNKGMQRSVASSPTTAPHAQSLEGYGP